MARKKNSAAAPTVGQVVGSTAEGNATATAAASGADVATLRVSLRQPHRFDDIPDGRGGTRSVELPSLDGALRGKAGGILTPEGNAVFFQLPRKDWEAVRAMHGQEQMFLPWNGHPPCVAEVGSLADAKAGAYADEIAATVTGRGPQDPAALGVAEAAKGD